VPDCIGHKLGRHQHRVAEQPARVWQLSEVPANRDGGQLVAGQRDPRNFSRHHLAYYPESARISTATLPCGSTAFCAPVQFDALRFCTALCDLLITGSLGE
jgi:hypothetical protein